MSRTGICDATLLTEQEKRMVRENGAMFLTGIIQKADETNRAIGRIYPRRTLEREINNYQKVIAERRSVRRT